MKNLRTLYPYTNESIEEINKKLENTDFDGIVLSVAVEEGRKDSFRILKQRKFDGNITSEGYVLTDFLRKVNLQDKQVFLSIVDLFYALDKNEKSIKDIRNYEILRKALKEVSGMVSNITINNNLYSQEVTRKEYFSNLKKEFTNIDYAYTMFNRYDDISEHKSIVPVNINIYNVVTYINLGKKVYLPEFESKVFARQFGFEELLKYYKPEEEARLGFSFNTEADITVISKENANKVLEKYREYKRR